MEQKIERINIMIKPILIKGIRKFNDHRGYFYESYKKSLFDKEYNIKEDFVQDNHSFSCKNTIRGLHYQWDMPMGKLVRVSNGSIKDVVVDIRFNSEKYGTVYEYMLSSENGHQLYVPPGFAHGFICLSETASVLYKCTSEYNSDGESGINPFDSSLDIDWGIKKEECIVSSKDLNALSFLEYKKNPKF